MGFLRGLPRSKEHSLRKFCPSQLVDDKTYTARVSYFTVGTHLDPLRKFYCFLLPL